MKTKVILIIILILIILCGVFWIVSEKNETEKSEEYQPEEELSVNEERKTMVSLYFRNKTTGKIEPEVRLIDVKELVNQPYETILNLLLEGPKKDTLETAIPEETKVNKTTLKGETLWIDFSDDFINNHQGGKEKEQQTIESLVKTFTDLTEINSIKILINGQEGKAFEDGEINFETIFIKEE